MHHPALELVSFEDVKLTFTREEWQYLSDAQRSLYKTVMLETYYSLLLVEQYITKPEVIIKLEQGVEPWTGEELPDQSLSDQNRQSEGDRVQHCISSGIHSQCKEWGNPLSDKSTQWNSGNSFKTESQPDDEYGHHQPNDEQCTTKPEVIVNLEQRAETWTGQEPATQSLSDQDRQSEGDRVQHCISSGIHSKCKEWGNPLSDKSTQWNSGNSFKTESQPDDEYGHHQPYEGKKCLKNFKCKVSLSTHLETQTRERTYKCKKCGKTIKWRKSHSRHVKIQKAEPLYECEDCSKTSQWKAGLSIHLNTPTGKKLYKCKDCHKIFLTKSRLSTHLICHTEERPYECKDCHIAFKWKRSLNRHVRNHTGKRPYECKECYRKFGRRSNLRSHLRSHTEERPYECKECHKTYKWKVCLTRHMKIHIRESLYGGSGSSAPVKRSRHRVQRTHKDPGSCPHLLSAGVVLHKQ